jgi:hypothetical protein
MRLIYKKKNAEEECITQKKEKLQEENILDILQIKQIRNKIYEGTKSES